MSTTENQVSAPLPAKRYFTAAEVCELCAIKPNVLRYWEQEFSAFSPAVKIRAPRRYYQHHEVQLLRRIRHLVYEEGFTLAGVRNQIEGGGVLEPEAHTAVRISAAELQAIRHDLSQLKVALEKALAY